KILCRRCDGHHIPAALSLTINRYDSRSAAALSLTHVTKRIVDRYVEARPRAPGCLTACLKTGAFPPVAGGDAAAGTARRAPCVAEKTAAVVAAGHAATAGNGQSGSSRAAAWRGWRSAFCEFGGHR